MNLSSIPFSPVYDDQPPAPPPATPPKSLSQDEVNKIVEQRLAEERKKFSKKETELLQKVEALDLSAKQKESLETQLEELRQATMTKEQLAAQAQEKVSKEHEKALKKASEERDFWKKTYHEEKVTVDLFAAASSKGEEDKEEAYNPSQLVDFFRGSARVSDEIGEDGKPTGRLVTKVKVSSVDKDGKSVVFDVPAMDAVKIMRADKARYGNLFKSGATGGLGNTTQRPTGGSDDISNMSMDELYKRYRENPASLGIRR